MKTLHFLFCTLACVIVTQAPVQAQTTLSAGNDTTICTPAPLTLNASVSINGSGLTGTTTAVTLQDDQYSGVLPIGFTFNFFGTNYTQCLISSNGIISFDVSQANNYCQWPIGAAIPTSSDPMNCIMCAWQDMLPPAGGVVTYGTYGTAPNRVFIMNYDQVAYFGCTNLSLCSGVCIYETSNFIESFIVNKPVCNTWNGGYAIHGIQNSTGTVAFWVPGRNYPSVWTCSNDAWRFAPTGPNTYTVTSIPFVPPSAGAIGSFTWYDMSGVALGSGSAITVNPPSTTSYYVGYSSCGVTIYDTVTVFVNPLSATVTSVPPTCNTSLNGSITVTPIGTTPPWTVSYIDSATGTTIASHPGITAFDMLSNLGIGTYFIHVTNSNGCLWIDTVHFTAVTPSSSFTFAPTTICQNGLVQFTNTTPGAPTGFSWTFGDNTYSAQTNPSHSFFLGGNYVVQLVSFFTGGCTDTATANLTVINNITSNFVFAPISICYGDTVHLFDQSTQHPVAWNWNMGDGSSDITKNPAHVFTGNPLSDNVYNVSLTVTDSLCGTDTKTIPITIYYNPHPFIGSDTNICPGESVVLNAQYPGNSYTWSTGETTQSITVSSDAPGTYSVIVDHHGCTGTDTAVVGIECDVFMTNAFTPNNDGKNDIFHPAGDKITNYKMWIYNRWGQQVDYVDANSAMEGWDGTHNGVKCEMGTYVYQIEAHFRNGGSVTKKGNVTLIR